jgi:hypothetical protein
MNIAEYLEILERKTRLRFPTCGGVDDDKSMLNGKREERRTLPT